MVNHQQYQSILDSYFSQVASVTKEFEDVLKEQTQVLHQLAEQSGQSLEEIQKPLEPQTPEQTKQNRPPHYGGGTTPRRQPDIFNSGD